MEARRAPVRRCEFEPFDVTERSPLAVLTPPPLLRLARPGTDSNRPFKLFALLTPLRLLLLVGTSDDGCRRPPALVEFAGTPAAAPKLSLLFVRIGFDGTMGALKLMIGPLVTPNEARR